MMDEVEKVTRETIKNGGVLATLYFDIHAKEKDGLQQLGAGFVNQMIQKEGVVYALGEIDEPIAGGGGKNWSSSIQVKLLARNFSVLAGLCIAHSPYNVEILRPDEIKMPLSEAHDLLAVMSATTAEYKKYIITKVAKPEDLAQINHELKVRAEMGKKVLEGKDKKEAEKDEKKGEK